MGSGASGRSALERLLGLLTLDPLDADLFIGETPRGEGRLFGGLVAAQAVMAGIATVDDDSALHSLHAYFLRPGHHGVPIRYVVHRIRDGRTFTTRRIVAYQGGEAIFNLSASFSRPEEGVSHQDEAPEAPEPEDLPDWEELRAKMLGRPEAVRSQPIDVRACDPDDPDGRAQEPRKRVWMRPNGPVPDDPRIYVGLLVYSTDRTLLSTACRPHGMPWGKRSVASLDHAVWIHRPPRFDDWHLYASESPVAHAARGLVLGAMYDRDGIRIASVAQEGLIRIPRS